MNDYDAEQSLTKRDTRKAAESVACSCWERGINGGLNDALLIVEEHVRREFAEDDDLAYALKCAERWVRDVCAVPGE